MIAAAGYDTVFNLALPTSPGALANEAAAVDALAARDLHRVWVPGGAWRTFIEQMLRA